MSDFGTGEVAVGLWFGCLAAIPMFGWWAVIALVGLVLSWLWLVSNANEKYHPDGTPRKNNKNHGRSGK